MKLIIGLIVAMVYIFGLFTIRAMLEGAVVLISPLSANGASLVGSFVQMVLLFTAYIYVRMK